jgi:Flp pilus assembly protein TadG
MKRRGNQRFTDGEKGAVTIEFVCTLPLFLVALAFAFEFGQFFLSHQSTVHNVRAASRYMARANVQDCAPGSIASNLVRTGQMADGTAPAYLGSAEISCQQDPVNSGIWTLRVNAAHTTLLLDFLGIQQASIPFVVREDFRVLRF